MDNGIFCLYYHILTQIHIYIYVFLNYIYDLLKNE